MIEPWTQDYKHSRDFYLRVFHESNDEYEIVFGIDKGTGNVFSDIMLSVTPYAAGLRRSILGEEGADRIREIFLSRSKDVIGHNEQDVNWGLFCTTGPKRSLDEHFGQIRFYSSRKRDGESKNETVNQMCVQLPRDGDSGHSSQSISRNIDAFRRELEIMERTEALSKLYESRVLRSSLSAPTLDYCSSHS
ncbi:hypothetical protein ACOME3_007939 [Neoechinorhynchus agilis]